MADTEQNSCVFCRIVAKKLPGKIEYEDDLTLAFHDINPRAKVHILVIPKKHLPTLKDTQSSDEPTMGRLFKVARDLAEKFGLEHYKLLMSVGREAGQEVFHIHLHLMSAPQ